MRKWISFLLLLLILVGCEKKVFIPPEVHTEEDEYSIEKIMSKNRNQIAAEKVVIKSQIRHHQPKLNKDTPLKAFLADHSIYPLYAQSRERIDSYLSHAKKLSQKECLNAQKKAQPETQDCKLLRGLVRNLKKESKIFRSKKWLAQKQNKDNAYLQKKAADKAERDARYKACLERKRASEELQRRDMYRGRRRHTQIIHCSYY